jgi:hypothetical protein
MSCRYFFDKTENVIFEEWQGPISIGDLMDFVKYNMDHEVFPPGIRAIFLAEEHPSFPVKEIPRFLAFLVSHRNQFQNARWAVVSNHPTVVAYMLIFKHLSIILPLEVGVFSTIEGALYWQKLTVSYYDEIKKKANFFDQAIPHIGR